MDYLQFGQNLLKQNPESYIVSGTHEGARVWVKKAAQSKQTFWHKLQNAFAKILKLPILSVTAITGGASSIQSEAQRLKDFAAKDISVPHVYAVDDGIMVVSDLGRVLTAVLAENKDAAFRQKMLLRAVDALLVLHKAGLAHGKPYLRDMTWQEESEQVGILDLEENPLAVMSLGQAQARDVWLFMSSVAKYARSPQDKYLYDPILLGIIFESYAGKADPQTLEALARFVGFLAPIGRLLEKKPFWRLIGSDARRAVIANQAISTKLKALKE